ncbi:hypothetical protein [Candidatus Protochlamydia phocaeensis]|uniref:hypothetical protein n=1 Tax=Candidatus Protochlamydia phocaeensis TaxID=1414722 RepID=UPI000837ADF1|nr:hypothetical protein [Candidatus Protochlamydia phocaeensis]
MSKRPKDRDDAWDPLSTDDQASEDHSIEEAADMVLESLQEGYQAEWEPFEGYTHKLRSHIHADEQAFRQKFAKGYESLLEVLDNSRKSV